MGSPARCRRVVRRAKVQRLQPLRGAADFVDIAEARGAFDDDFEADLLLAAHDEPLGDVIDEQGRDLTALGDPKRLRSGWLNGLTEWKVDLGVCPVTS